MRVSHLVMVSISLPNGFVAWKFQKSFPSIFTSSVVSELPVIGVLAFVRGGITYYTLPLLKWKLVGVAGSLPSLESIIFQRGISLGDRDSL